MNNLKSITKSITVMSFILYSALLLTGCSKEMQGKYDRNKIGYLMKQVKCIDGINYFVNDQKVTSVKINNVSLKPEVCGK